MRGGEKRQHSASPNGARKREKRREDQEGEILAAFEELMTAEEREVRASVFFSNVERCGGLNDILLPLFYAFGVSL
jgi:hypothetical protein